MTAGHFDACSADSVNIDNDKEIGLGNIRAAFEAVRGGLADQWLEVIEANDMSDTTVMTTGVKVRNDKRNRNIKGTDNIVSQGSIIHVYPNQFMILTDGGRVVDYSAEPGYYKVDNSSSPSLFSGQFGEALKETFSRVKYGEPLLFPEGYIHQSSGDQEHCLRYR